MALDKCFGKRVRDPTLSYDPISTYLTARTPVQHLLFIYAVDLTHILRELFAITFEEPGSKVPTWSDLKKAVKTYAQSPSRQNIHRSIRSYYAEWMDPNE